MSTRQPEGVLLPGCRFLPVWVCQRCVTKSENFSVLNKSLNVIGRRFPIKWAHRKVIIENGVAILWYLIIRIIANPLFNI